jgi:spermidine/putrescine transport system permease protein
MEHPVPADLPDVAVPRRKPRRGKRLIPYWLMTPGALWLLVIFLVPMAAMASLSLQQGNSRTGFSFTWHFANYSDGLRAYGSFFTRSVRNGLIVTVAALLIGYPMAYWIAFYGGRRKSFFLFLVLLPFFVSFVIRTLSWSFILSDDGIVFAPLKRLGVVPQSFHILATTFAVIAGITYNLLPFAVLPLFVSLDRIDKRLVEAAGDLYCSQREAFRRVVLPLSVPGIFAAVLLTFIPAVGDYVNADVLGGPGTTMIGNIIQTQFIVNRNYPIASALSFILMAGMLVGAIAYAKVLGTEEVTT